MTEKLNPIARLDELPLEPFEQGEHYRSLDADISDRLGLTQIGAALSNPCPIDLPPLMKA